MNKEEFDNLTWFIKRLYMLYWSLQWVYADIKDWLFPNSTVFEKVDGSYVLKKEYRNNKKEVE